MLFKTVCGDETQLDNVQGFDIPDLTDFFMEFTHSHWLPVVFCFIDLILIAEFQRNVEFSVPTSDGIIVIVRSDVGDAGKSAAFCKAGEKAAAQFFKSARDIFCQQGGSNLLIKKRFRTDHLQCASVRMNVSEPETEQIVIDLIEFLLCIIRSVDREQLADQFGCLKGFQLLGQTAGTVSLQCSFQFGVLFLSVAQDGQNTFRVDGVCVICQQDVGCIEGNRTAFIQDGADNVLFQGFFFTQFLQNKGRTAENAVKSDLFPGRQRRIEKSGIFIIQFPKV